MPKPRSNLPTIFTLPPIVLLYILGISIAAFLLGHPEFYRDVRFYDEGVYVVLSKALASGSGYVHESLPGVPPEGKYPPAFPLFLSLIWRLFPNFPENLVIMRIFVFVTSYLFLCVSYKYLTENLQLNYAEALGLVTMLGLHPTFVHFAVLVATEMPYAFFSFLILYCYSHFLAENKTVHLILILCFASLAATTRTIGFVLFLALIIHLLIIRRIKPFLFTTAYAGCVFSLWQVWSSYSAQAYVGYPSAVAMNYVGYVDYLDEANWIDQLKIMLPVNFEALVKHWTWFVFPWGQNTVLMPILLALGVYFYARRKLVEKIELHDLYALFSLLTILLWPWPRSDRFLLTFSPLLIAFSFIGIQDLTVRILGSYLSDRLKVRLRTVLISLIVATAVVYNLIVIQTHRGNRQLASHFYNEFRITLDWLRDQTPPNAVLVGDADSAYYLFTNRKAIRLSYPDPYLLYYSNNQPEESSRSDKLVNWFKDTGACYLILETPGILTPWELLYSKLVNTIVKNPSSSYARIYISPHKWFSVYKDSTCST